MSPDASPLLCAQDVVVRYGHGGARGGVAAVNGVTFDLPRGATLGLVGESGCGKSTLARGVLWLRPVSAGRVVFDGVDLARLSRAERRRLRRRMQIVFQDPLGSLNPRQRIGDAVGEGLRVHRVARGAAVRERVAGLLDRVGLRAAEMGRYPHELSGGQRQRVAIARALAPGPELLVCDEPVSALDVSLQAQILSLLADLKRELGLTYLFISHNLAVVEAVSDAVAVMYAGRFVETGRAAEVFRHPRHPYTRLLLDSVPAVRPGRRRHPVYVTGDPPSPVRLPGGCPFHPRCPFVVERCRSERPELASAPAGPVRRVACHRSGEDLFPPPGPGDARGKT